MGFWQCELTNSCKYWRIYSWQAAKLHYESRAPSASQLSVVSAVNRHWHQPVLYLARGWPHAIVKICLSSIRMQQNWVSIGWWPKPGSRLGRFSFYSPPHDPPPFFFFHLFWVVFSPNLNAERVACLYPMEKMSEMEKCYSQKFSSSRLKNPSEK